MATRQHTRTRSARLANPFHRNGQPAAEQGQGPAPVQRHVANSSAVLSSGGGDAGGQSALSAFLTNLRLLNLDLRPDWPGISVEVFSGTANTGVQGQKKRVQCVEWALFRLFELWDPDEAASKLKPFFPPLDQLQSRNLRAALLRALEQAKKNGVLGRDALIRKTMLDECKGDRLEEVLAYLSTAVLRKLVIDDLAAEGEYPALAVSLASEDRGYRGEKSDIASLVFAHKVSLHRLLERKAAENTQYRDFADLLRIKERGISRRDETLRTQGDNGFHGSSLSDTARAEMRRVVRNNWSGNEAWMETLLSGGPAAPNAGLFNVPFDRVWRRVQQGRLSELEEHGTGLLEQLENRVKVQNERLQRWDAFRRKTFTGRPMASPSKQRAPEKKTKGIDLGFNLHQDLHIERMSSRTTITSRAPQMNDYYAGLVQDLDDELARNKARRSRRMNFANIAAPQLSLAKNLRPSEEEEAPEAVSDMSDLEEEVDAPQAPEPPVSLFQGRRANSTRQPVRPKLSHSGSNHSSSKSSGSVIKKWPSYKNLRNTEIDPMSHPRSRPESYGSGPSASSRSQSRSPTRHALNAREPSPDLQPPPSPTQDMADQILESMNDASPSPTKRPKPRHTLSLAERTRLSMVRGSSLFMDEDEAELPLRPAAANTQVPNSDSGGKTPVDEAPQDLVSRTRLSMAGFEKAKQKAQAERRRSLRRSKMPPRREGSYFPKVEEEDGGDQAVLADELMAEEDMEAVFRSRPKIQASPIPSPTRELEFDYE